MSAARAMLSAMYLVGAVAYAAAATAGELRVLSAAAVKGPLAETAAAFEKETGHRVDLVFATAGQIERMMTGGERADLVVNARPRLDALLARGERQGALRDLGIVRVGVAVHAGARRPDVSTVEAFRESLLAASTVAYTNPAAGGTAGTYFAGMLERLGIADAMLAKRRLASDGLDVMRKVVAGEAELGITQVSEILFVDRTTFGGLLPESLQLLTTYAVFVPDSASPTARALVDALTSDLGRARFKASGFD